MNTKEYDKFTSEEGLPIDLGTTLQLQVDGVPDRLTGVLVGMVADELLIIQGPFNSVADKLFEGNKTTVRYAREGIVNGFGSELIGATTTPVELAFIKYPEKIETIELRSHRRMECFLPAELIIGKEKCSGVIKDISEKGCKFITEITGSKELPAITKDEQLTLVVQLPEIEDTQTVLGEARNVQIDAEFDAEELYVGVKFHDDTPDPLKRIAEYVSSVTFFDRLETTPP